MSERVGDLAAWCAGLALLVGAAAVGGWLFGIDWLLQAGSGRVPIRFNSALGLALIGAALLASARSRHVLAALLALPVALLAAPALVQELAGVDMGVDQLLFHQTLTAEGFPPGRMAPNTAFALLLAALLVCGLALYRGREAMQILASLGGAGILLLAAVALAGYLYDVPLARAWGQHTPMALLAAIGLAAAGLALAWLGRPAWSRLSPHSRGVSVLGGALVAGCALGGWFLLDARLGASLHQRVEAQAEHAAQWIQIQAHRELQVVPALARRLERLGTMPDEDDFRREAEIQIEVFEVSHILAWVDREAVIRTMEAREPAGERFGHVIGTSMLLDTPRREAFATALAERRPVLSGVTRLAATGEEALLLLAPVTIDDVVVGMVGAAIALDPLFGTLLAPAIADHAIRIGEGERLLWTSPQAAFGGASLGARREAYVFGRAWQIEVLPTAALVRMVRGTMPEQVLMAGLLLAGLVALLLALAGLARERMRFAEDARRALEQAEHRAGRILDSITDGFLGIDRDWRYVHANAAALQYVGRGAGELLGQRIWDVFPELVGTETQRRFEDTMRSGVPCSFEMHHTPLRSWYEVRAYPSEEGLSVFFRDVTAMHAARDMLERSEKQLRQAQAVASLGSWELDLKAGTVTVSGQFFILHGIEVQTFDGTWTAFLAMLPAEVAECMVRAQRCAMAGERCELTYTLDVDGERRTFFLNAEAIVMPDGAGTVVTATVQDVTAQEQARLRLVESEARHRGIVEASLDGIVTIDADGRIIEFNPAAERIFGRTREQAIGRELAELVIPEPLRERHRRGLRTHLDSGNSSVLGRQVQMPALRADGSEFQVELGISRIDATAAPLFTGFVRDISERLRAERELKRQARIIDQINDAVAEVDMDGIVRSWNKGAERLLGYSAEEMIGQSIERIYPPDWLARRPSMIEEPLLTYGEHYIEVEQQRKDGVRIWVQLSLSVLRDKQGRPTGSLGYAFDITRRRQAEDELRLQQRAIEASANGIVIVDALDPAQPILFVNPAFEDITGYDTLEVLGRNCRFLQGEDRDQPALNELRRAIAEERSCRVLLRNYRKDGAMFWNDLHVAPVYAEDGRVSHFVGVQNDVTERRQHELLLEHRALHDELTGLPNRARMLELLGEAIAAADSAQARISVVLVNLDRLHQINDALGYAVGDHVILEAADRLVRLASRVGTRVARIGGDEFLLMEPQGSPGEPEDGLAERAIAELSRPYEVHGQRVFLTASAGISVYPEASQDPVTLVAHADIAVKRAKQAGRNQVAMFTSGMAAELAERVTLGAALRGALAGDELALHLQPLVDARNGAIRAVEALMRWTSAELGPVSPARFVPVAEDSGLIIVLDDWTLRSALELAAAWPGA
ncbi:MAG TPA: PAS domain S-box protein, partial [Xanthomonadaceae bacterium]|nr:PAS domain S-box protein [Xanthomonadaceae bacterium]